MVKMMPYCPKCGKEVVEGTNFCPNCGADVRPERPPTRPARIEKREKEEKAEKKEKAEKEEVSPAAPLIGGILIFVGITYFLSAAGLVTLRDLWPFLLLLLGVAIVLAAIYAGVIALKRTPQP